MLKIGSKVEVVAGRPEDYMVQEVHSYGSELKHLQPGADSKTKAGRTKQARCLRPGPEWLRGILHRE